MDYEQFQRFNQSREFIDDEYGGKINALTMAIVFRTAGFSVWEWLFYPKRKGKDIAKMQEKLKETEKEYKEELNKLKLLVLI